MDQILEDFITALRSAGVRISTSESIDAYRVLGMIGYEKKEILRDALSAALAKSAAEKELFDPCFDLFFSPDWIPVLPEAGGRGRNRHGVPPLAAMLLYNRRDDLAAMLAEAAGRMDRTGLQLPTQRGVYAQRLLEMMGFRDAEAYWKRLRADVAAGAGAEAEALEQGMRHLKESVEKYTLKQYELYSGRQAKELLEERLMDSRLYQLDSRDLEKVKDLVGKIAKKLNDVHSRRKKSAKRGQLDFKKTLRDNITYQEMLFDPKWKRKKVNRPDVMVLCDVSRSMSWVVRFFLLLLYSLNEQIARIRTFIFCSELKEVTDLFEKYPADKAVDRILSGSELNLFMALTDYGQALKDFKEIALDDVTRKTTVLILGDARNNFFNSRIEILRSLSERCKRLVWLNPEVPCDWETGDSEMRRYAPFCHLVRECSTLRHLERLIGPLLRANH